MRFVTDDISKTLKDFKYKETLLLKNPLSIAAWEPQIDKITKQLEDLKYLTQISEETLWDNYKAALLNNKKTLPFIGFN